MNDIQGLTPQQKYSKTLRDIADWYDNHPNAPCRPHVDRYSHYFRATPEEIRAIGAGEKEYKDTLFQYHVKGDGFHIEFYAARESVCVRKVVGHKEVPELVVPARAGYVIPAKTEPIYEYDCKPLLEEVEA